MKIIVAIGGGEIRKFETLEIDRIIVEMTGLRRPKALFIPTASGDSQNYWEAFQRLYGARLGCETNVLMLIRGPSDPKEIIEKIGEADLVYVGGGNTLRMMRRWRRLGVDKLLLQAYERDTVLSGLSAGSICWFRYGHSDSRKFSASGEDWDFIRVRGLGLVSATNSPGSTDEARIKSFQKMICQRGGVGIAIDDNCAMVIRDETYEVVRCRRNANVYRLHRRRGEVFTEEIPSSGNMSDILKSR